MGDQTRRFRGLLVNTVSLLVVIMATVYIVWPLRALLLPIILGVLLAYVVRPLKTAFRYKWLPEGIRVALMIGFVTGSILFAVNLIQKNIPNAKESLEIKVRLKYKFNQRFDKMMGIDPATGKGNAFYDFIAHDIDPLRRRINDVLDLTSEEKANFVNFYKGVEGYDPVPESYYQYYIENNRKKKLLAKIEETKQTETTDQGQITAKPSEKSFLLVLLDTISVWFLMPIVFIYVLLDKGTMNQFLLSMIPNRYFELALNVQDAVDSAIGKYLRGISAQCGLVALTLFLGLWVIGIPFGMSLTIGVLSGISTAVPFLGPIMGLGLGTVYVLIAENIEPMIPFVTIDNAPLAVLIVNALVLALDNMVYQPFVLGHAVSLHPLVVIIGLMGGSMLFGAAGVLLAIPTIVVLNVIVTQIFKGLKEYRII